MRRRHTTRYRAHITIGLLACAAISLSACASSGSKATSPDVTTSAAAGSNQSATGFHLVHPGYLTVAFTDGNLPEIAQTADGQLVGIDGAWITEFAKAHGLKLKLFSTAFANQILAVQQGKADLGTTAYYTTERAKQVYYTGTYLADTTGVYLKKGTPYSGPDSLKGKKLGTLQGYTFGPYMVKTYGKSDVVYFQGIAQLYTALKNGQIYGLVNGSIGQFQDSFKPFEGDFDFHPLKPGDMGFTGSLIKNTDHNYVKCDNADLATAMNDTLKQLIDSGQWTKILAKYTIPASYGALASPTPPTELCSR